MADEPLDESLGDSIALLIEQEYQKLSPACRPITRSNGLKEWTVLAGIVAVSSHRSSKNRTLRLISIGTGVKALPDALISRSQGRMVHDCHAEMMVLRGLNSVLLEHIKSLEKDASFTSDLIERLPNSNYVLKSEWDLALYVSTLPCGDASMNLLTKTDFAKADQNVELAFQEDDQVQWVDEKIRTIVRGRFNYSKLGVVRTKPGRFDSQISYSKSCSDKLCAKQATSVLNSLTWDLIKDPIFLKYLVVPREAYHSGLNGSFQNRLGNLPFQALKVLACNKSFCDRKSELNDEPSSMSCVKLFIDQQGTAAIEQAILNGVKNGFYTKCSKPLRKNCEPVVSRYAQWKLFTEIRPQLSCMTYLGFKATQKTRNKLIHETRIQLSADGWVKTWEDDFQL